MDPNLTVSPVTSLGTTPGEPNVFDLRALRNIAWHARSDRPAIRDESGKLIGLADPRLPEDLTIADLSTHLTYTDRDSYLAWVIAWKSAYAALSAQIRADKAKCRAQQRAGDSNASRLQVSLHDDASSARMLLALRRVAKTDSWSRALAARAAVGVEV